MASALQRPAAACLRATALPSLRLADVRPYNINTSGNPPSPDAAESSTSSAPDAAEKASAQSGGSRSKESVETGSSPTAGAIPDALAEGDARGRTGGGQPLESSVEPPPQPKISNASVPGERPNLTAEQQREVDEHNREFEKKHGRADPAGDDKVDSSYWSGKGSRQSKD
ncbi:hypothetical protein N657DRAFT_650845 [Parathielavia appendiculata]|uniref:Uncharacterized protein n=1 Tax=Parathielavia appendiculata TaxID=2587402 RepID=A0AAN6TQM8_9PEZI|nr:hypothetical protein N657DRAFT_650845 [Parathielavia appendiculata]